ncbi:hypothetical protein ZIOFF_034898 [Zingiber officinale]|uniref:PRONE domain-containing protein n=1 Tax=Zingiber officinale TaxID=94328 RepID=A0A8J5KX53_ZINOF|nr:hypothetical protein ZIOFF_034898 [Zingiber officinale]
MNGSSRKSDENSEMDRHLPSSKQLWRLNTDTSSSAPISNCTDYSRTTSGMSSYSEHSNEQSSSYDFPPVGRPISLFISSDCCRLAEIEMVKEKFSKLLLGEDMSGGGKGVCAAVAVSNAITNLYATVFGHFYKLEPLPVEKRTMWRREMDCLLSVCDHIVEFYPCSHTLSDGTSIEMMGTKSRSDISINLPALEKLDAMLLEQLEGFQKTEFWYVEEGKQASAPTRSFRKVVERTEDKWWLPIPCVPSSGLSAKAKKELRLKRECTNQIHKAAMAINSSVLAEMDVPESYIAALPKSTRACIGDSIYRHLSTADKFSPDCLLDQIEISSEHEALEMADRLEASMFVWRRRAGTQASKSSWGMVKDLIGEENKNEMLASRAEILLLSLKQRHPGLAQTTLDTCKIQYNKDLGHAILESYSRVLESLAFNIVAWIDDVLFVHASVKRRLKAKQQKS